MSAIYAREQSLSDLTRQVSSLAADLAALEAQLPDTTCPAEFGKVTAELIHRLGSSLQQMEAKSSTLLQAIDSELAILYDNAILVPEPERTSTTVA